jgi:hypothetical protein
MKAKLGRNSKLGKGKKSRNFLSFLREKVEVFSFPYKKKISKDFENFPHREKVEKNRDFLRERKSYILRI